MPSTEIHAGRACAAALVLLLALAPSDTRADGPGKIRWEPYEYETRTGDLVTDGELGRLTVPERHASPDGNTIDLAFIRFRSTAEHPGPPVIWLAGGPSDYGSDDIEGPYLRLVREFQRVGDVIALDQRGTGLTRPLLECPGTETVLPLDRPYDRDLAMAEYLRLSRECAAYFASQGIDLSAYNTRESAHDVDFLRRALGVPEVHLYGGSYGSHLAFAVLRYHPEAVARVVVSGIEGPDQTWKLPSHIDRFFEEVFAWAGKDEVARTFPDLGMMVRAVRKRLEDAPVTVELPGEDDAPSEAITFGVFDLQLALRAFLGSPRNISQLPSIFSDLYDGDYVAVARYLRRLRSVGVASAMYYCMDCASGASPERLERIAAEAPGSIIGTVNFPFPAVCEGWPNAELGDAFRSPLRVDRPTLFLSGSLDGHTPPSNAAEVAAGFSRATFVLVEGASHQSTELDPPELTRRLADFLLGEATTDTTFVVPFTFATPENDASD